jgi:ribosome-associated toxin RatA of RatAB toxin-antitoxin module
MKHVKKSVLIWHSPHEMYALVTGVSDYPKFLPWCDRAEVVEHTPDGMVARLGLAFGGVRQTFTTRNRHVPDRRVELRLVEGLFSNLEGTWDFVPLGPPGEERSDACRIDFELRYAFANRVLDALVSPVFDKIADTFVDSFVRRAGQVYGEP